MELLQFVQRQIQQRLVLIQAVRHQPPNDCVRIPERHAALDQIIRTVRRVREAAGRALLTNDGETAFKAGASASITGNMLTTVACATIRSDRKMLADMGRDVTPEYWKEV